MAQNKQPQKEQDPSWILTHCGEEYDRYERAIVPPIYMNSLNVFPTIESYYEADPFHDPHVFTYGRVTNPTVAVAERKIAALEHGSWAALFASGMAAASAAILACCHAGSQVVCIRNSYGPIKSYVFAQSPNTFEAYAEWNATVDQEIQKYLAGSITVDDLLAYMDEYWSTALEEEGQKW